MSEVRVSSVETIEPTANDPAKRVLSAAVNVSDVLSAIASEPRGVTAKALARRLHHSLSATYYTLQTLASLSLVEPSPCASGLYILGPRIAELFRGYVASQVRPERLAPVLTDLREASSAKAYLGAWSQGDLEITHAVGRRGATELKDVSAGFRGGAHALAIGKVLLSTTRRDRWPSYLRGDRFEMFTPATVVTAGQLHEELARTRADGWAEDVEEFRERVCCIAAPIRDSAGRVIAAMGISVTPNRFERERGDLVREVRRAAAEASEIYSVLDPLSELVREIAGMTPHRPIEPYGVAVR